MAINLSNVNVSIQQFQAVASGEVNAGEVKLTSETTLGKVNNFVSRKWKNKTDHTHEEVLAVKSAFIRALNSCGVVGDELARVRARLGLAPEPGDAVDHTLGARSITPLTRQEVREILDRYAGTINGVAGAGTIRTADELSAGMSEKERNARARCRNEVNASLNTSRLVTANHDMMFFDRLVAGDFEGLRNDYVPRMREIAQAQLAALREKVGDNPPADDHPCLSFQLPGGQVVEVQARGSSADILAQLEDAVFFLTYKPYPNEDEIVPPMSAAKWNDSLKDALQYNDTNQVMRAGYAESAAAPCGRARPRRPRSGAHRNFRRGPARALRPEQARRQGACQSGHRLRARRRLAEDAAEPDNRRPPSLRRRHQKRHRPCRALNGRGGVDGAGRNLE